MAATQAIKTLCQWSQAVPMHPTEHELVVWLQLNDNLLINVKNILRLSMKGAHLHSWAVVQDFTGHLQCVTKMSTRR